MGMRLREIIGRGPDSKVGVVGSRERSGDFGCLQLFELEPGWVR